MVVIDADGRDQLLRALGIVGDSRKSTLRIALNLENESVDEDTRTLIEAFGVFDEIRAWTAAQAAQHPKGPDGKFIKTADLVADALRKYLSGGSQGPNPLDGYNRAQLVRVAKARGVKLRRGASESEIKSALTADVSAGGTKPVAVVAPSLPAVPPVPAPGSADPMVQAALDVIYGVDPKSKTAARQLFAYGGLRRAQFAALRPEEQSTLLGDLAYIATTSRGPNKGRAQGTIDRFTPPGTPPGVIPSQPIVPPPSAVAAQWRAPDPTGRPGLLKMLSPNKRGSNGDGWTRTASGRTGPWGQYGAGGLMLRHVGDDGQARYLMVQRGPGISDPGKWQFPGGAKDEKESFYEGATREVVEELGFSPSDLDTARVHGTHTTEAPDVTVPGMYGGTMAWAYVSVAATVPKQLKPDLSTHHARMETSDAKWMTEAEIDALDQGGKLLRPLAGGQLKQNVISLFPPVVAAPGRPGPRTTKPPRLSGTPPAPVAPTAHKPSRGSDLIPDKAAEDHLRAEVSKVRKNYRGKSADERLAAIGAMQGYDDTPTVLPKDEIDRLLATGDYVEAWRGATGASGYSPRGGYGGGGKSAADINEDMRSGPAYYGTGIFGNGYYLSTKRSVAEDYADGTKNSIIRVLIPKVAKTETHDIVARKAKGTSSSVGAYQYVGRGGMGGGTLHDEGRYAAAVGLDGVEIQYTARTLGGGAGHIATPGSPSYNWVNRSVLIIQEAER